MKLRIGIVIVLALSSLGCDTKPKPVVPVTTGPATPPVETEMGSSGAAAPSAAAPAPPPP